MKNITFILAIFLVSNLSAQTIERQLIGSAGGSFANATHDLNFSAGEAVIVTETSGSIILTQGFQQDDLGLVGIKELEKESISLYPNPVNTTLNIHFLDDASKNGEISVLVYDNQGKLVYQQEENLASGYGNIVQLDLSFLTNGMYVIHIKDAVGLVSRKNITKI